MGAIRAASLPLSPATAPERSEIKRKDLEVRTEMLQIGWDLGVVVVHTLIVYLFLILLLSLIGYRQASEVGIVELVVIMVLGSAVETALIAGNTSLLAGLTSATTLFLADRVFDTLQNHSPRLTRAFVGRPILLVSNGHLLPRRARQAGLTEDDVRQGVRERGYENLDQVKFAVLERDGTISVIPRDRSPTRRSS